jgi:hypothetical protein
MEEKGDFVQRGASFDFAKPPNFPNRTRAGGDKTAPSLIRRQAAQGVAGARRGLKGIVPRKMEGKMRELVHFKRKFFEINWEFCKYFFIQR